MKSKEIFELTAMVRELNDRMRHLEKTFGGSSLALRNRSRLVLKAEAKKIRKITGIDHRTQWAQVRKEFGVSSWQDIPEIHVPRALQLLRQANNVIALPTAKRKRISA